jgi:hypothetical protein
MNLAWCILSTTWWNFYNKFVFNYQMPYPNLERIGWFNTFKIKTLRWTNIWTNDLYNEINDSQPTIPIINTINIEHNDLQSNFVIQSCNESNQKSQFLEDENFIKPSYSLMMEKFEYRNLFRHLNDKQRLIFDVVMHRK